MPIEMKSSRMALALAPEWLPPQIAALIALIALSLIDHTTADNQRIAIFVMILMMIR